MKICLNPSIFAPEIRSRKRPFSIESAIQSYLPFSWNSNKKVASSCSQSSSTAPASDSEAAYTPSFRVAFPELVEFLATWNLEKYRLAFVADHLLYPESLKNITIAQLKRMGIPSSTDIYKYLEVVEVEQKRKKTLQCGKNDELTQREKILFGTSLFTFLRDHHFLPWSTSFALAGFDSAESIRMLMREDLESMDIPEDLISRYEAKNWTLFSLPKSVKESTDSISRKVWPIDSISKQATLHGDLSSFWRMKKPVWKVKDLQGITFTKCKVIGTSK